MDGTSVTPRSIRFIKMHGAGNDYVYVDLWQESVPEPRDLAIKVSHRRLGIGSDGLILVAPPEHPGAVGRMIMFNADGSESSMCGNGLRCVARILYDRGRTGGATQFVVETGAGPRRAEVHLANDGQVGSVTIDMGPPILEAERIPSTLEGGRAARIDTPRGAVEGIPVGMGNPHFVIFVDDVESYPVHEVGSFLETHPSFPKRTNVEFVQVLGPSHLRQRTWERGSGETWACGSGACAVAVAAGLKGLAHADVRIDLLGGTLQLRWPGHGSVFMTGEAVEVFQGSFPLAAG